MTGPGDGPVLRDQALRRQLERYEVRYNEAFWSFFEARVRPELPEAPVLVDLACGPGLFLLDVSKLLPAAVLHGYDAGQDMIESAAVLEYAGAPPTLGVQDVERKRLPLTDGSVDLLSIAAAMHTFDDPWPLLGEVRRVLKPLTGRFLLYDWFRVPMRDYIAQRLEEPGDAPDDRYPRALQMFAAHNRFTADDWRWILAQGRYDIVAAAGTHARARAWLAKPI